MTHTYQIEGMTCSKCVGKVRSQLLSLGEVSGAEIQLEFPQATITMMSHVDLAELQEAVGKAGAYKISYAAGDSGHTMEQSTGDSYFPIFLLFLYLLGATVLYQVASGEFDFMMWMRHFMAGFFLVFSFFKLLDIRGFSEGYRTYDIIAKVFPAWGFIYPFLELGLGLAFLTGFMMMASNLITIVLMTVGLIGVAKTMLQKRKIRCACLGTIFKLPLGTVTLVENALMLVMAVFGYWMY